MRTFLSSLAVVAICLVSVPVHADEYGDWDKESYPKELVKRPLLLSASMFEVRFGVASDFVSSNSADLLDLKMDFLYGLATRFQMGVETAVATNDFAVNDAAVWAEYSFMPNVSGRVGGVMIVQRDAMNDLDDPTFGVRFWLPMKFKLGEKAAVVASPRITFIDGDSVLETPLGIQYQLLSAIALTANTGLMTRNFEFDDDPVATWGIPLSAGAVLHFTRKIDLTVEFIFPDVANDSDFRLLMGYFSFRG